jgi:Alpha/beta hydrolase family
MPVRIKIATALALLLSGVHAQASDCVVLLHGMLRSADSMERMEKALAEAGFETVNVDYPSRDGTIEVLAPLAVEAGLGECREKPDLGRINFVTHSLGGILLRQYLVGHEIPELGRVVMLGPPNQGSLAVDRMQNVPGFDLLNGPAARQLGKGENSVPLSLPPADFEVGVIAGNRTIDPVTSAVLPDPDDGKVSVEDTWLEGMSDFVIVKHSHAFMMRMPDVIDLTIRFLETGSFDDK